MQWWTPPPSYDLESNLLLLVRSRKYPWTTGWPSLIEFCNRDTKIISRRFLTFFARHGETVNTLQVALNTSFGLLKSVHDRVSSEFPDGIMCLAQSRKPTIIPRNPNSWFWMQRFWTKTNFVKYQSLLANREHLRLSQILAWDESKTAFASKLKIRESPGSKHAKICKAFEALSVYWSAPLHKADCLQAACQSNSRTKARSLKHHAWSQEKQTCAWFTWCCWI